MWQITESDMWSLGCMKLPYLRAATPADITVDVWDHSAARERQMAVVKDFLRNRIQTPYGVLYPHIREPWHEWSMVYSRENLGWHHDDASMAGYLAVWANEVPTEVRRVGTKQIYQAAPFEMLLFDNTKFEHRSPPKGRRDWSSRWFVRSMLSKDTTVRDVSGIFALDA